MREAGTLLVIASLLAVPVGSADHLDDEISLPA
jgi:hypothetical protein